MAIDCNYTHRLENIQDGGYRFPEFPLENGTFILKNAG
jgi:hypothetical protein